MLQTKFARIAPFATGAALMAGSSLANAELPNIDVAGNVAVTNNYIWRGITQTNDEPAVQGGLDISHSSGLYAGTWVSNVDFADPATASASSPASLSEIEQDWYAGYAGGIGDFSYDVGYLYFSYPQTSSADFGEVYASVGYSYLTLQANYTTNSQVDAGRFTEDDLYYKAALDVPIINDISVSATVGQYDFEDDAAEDYTHYNLYLNKGNFSFGVEQNDEEGEFPTGKAADDPRVVVSYSKTFDLL